MTSRAGPLIAPSLLGADFSRLGPAVRDCADAGADLIHCDIMDGNFVPAISFGSDICAAAGRSSSIPLDVHLMVDVVPSQIAQVLPIGPAFVSFHIEAVADPLAVADQIREGGSRPGIAIKPGTPFSAISEIAAGFDLVLIMTVEPGAGGQEFMPECLPKISAAAELRRKTKSAYLIEVDGGVGPETIRSCARGGADVFVAGSAVFGHPSGVEAAVRELRTLAESG